MLERSAVASIKGYHYQLWHFLNDILNSSCDQNEYIVEGIKYLGIDNLIYIIMRLELIIILPQLGVGLNLVLDHILKH
jgi:hypothetical protein